LNFTSCTKPCISNSPPETLRQRSRRVGFLILWDVVSVCETGLVFGVIQGHFVLPGEQAAEKGRKADPSATEVASG
jgi:hypothetical protein